MNLKIRIMCIFACFFILTGCTANKNISYISYTQTRQEEDKLISSVYYYDLNNTPQKVYEFEYNSGYPLGVYDKKNELVYYTQKQNDINALLKYDIKNKTVSNIATRTSAVNDIVLLKNDNLLIVSYDKEENNHNMYPFIYDTRSATLKRLDLNPILSITDVKYDFNTNTAYFAGWLKEDEDRIIKDKEGYNNPLQRYIYAYHFDQDKFEFVYKGESEFDTFGIDMKNNLIYVGNDEEKLIEYSLETKKSKLSSIQDLRMIVNIENNNYYGIRKNLYKVVDGDLKNISNIDKNMLETVNNAIFVKQ